MSSEAQQRVLGLVMAAGFSRRFGSADKRLAKLADGSTLLGATLAQLQAEFSAPGSGGRLAVVIRPDDDPACLGISEQLDLLRAPNAGAGLGASIADAARAVSADPVLNGFDSLAIMLGDMPGLKPDTIRALVSASGRDRIVRPRYRQQPGHPVLFGRDFWSGLCNLQGDEGARAVIAANRAALRQLDLDDAGVIADIDTPAQLR
ncbi:nucleotidyltransferase family protein [Marinobacterium sp. YM272]|uniref:nucleotidyltransferase family protein n=1 Tax=Marinobacterium sp. YM272 TaxID=3421654 RepID=UPI003D7F80E7